MTIKNFLLDGFAKMLMMSNLFLTHLSKFKARNKKIDIYLEKAFLSILAVRFGGDGYGRNIGYGIFMM